jgi:hypothetical protein
MALSVGVLVAGCAEPAASIEPLAPAAPAVANPLPLTSNSPLRLATATVESSPPASTQESQVNAAPGVGEPVLGTETASPPAADIPSPAVDDEETTLQQDGALPDASPPEATGMDVPQAADVTVTPIALELPPGVTLPSFLLTPGEIPITPVPLDSSLTVPLPEGLDLDSRLRLVQQIAEALRQGTRVIPTPGTPAPAPSAGSLTPQRTQMSRSTPTQVP